MTGKQGLRMLKASSSLGRIWVRLIQATLSGAGKGGAVLVGMWVTKTSLRPWTPVFTCFVVDRSCHLPHPSLAGSLLSSFRVSFLLVLLSFGGTHTTTTARLPSTWHLP